MADDYGYVVGTFIHPLGSPAPTDRPALGCVTFMPHQIRHLADPSRTAGRITEKIEFTQDGKISGWLVTGLYNVRVTFSDGTSMPVFPVRVENTHTPLAPLDLNTAQPPIPYPDTVIIVSEAERIRAEAAAAAAEEDADRADAAADRAEAAAGDVDVALNPAVVGGTITNEELHLFTHGGTDLDIGPVGKPILHFQQISELANAEPGPAVWHYSADVTYDPDLPDYYKAYYEWVGAGNEWSGEIRHILDSGVIWAIEFFVVTDHGDELTARYYPADTTQNAWTIWKAPFPAQPYQDGVILVARADSTSSSGYSFQVELPDATSTPHSVMGRDATGNSAVTTPTYDVHIANKKYVDDQIFHVYQAGDLQNVTKAGPAIFHWDPARAMNPPMDPNAYLDPAPTDYAGQIFIVDYDEIIPGVKQVMALFTYVRGGGGPTLLSATAWQNYEAAPYWSFAPISLPTAAFDGTLLVWDNTSKSWVSRYIGDPGNIVVKNGAGQITVPVAPQAGAAGLYNATSAYYVNAQSGVAPVNTLNASAQPNPLNFDFSNGAGGSYYLYGTQVFRINMNANLNVTFTALTPDGYRQVSKIVLVLIQDATGGRTLTIPASVKRAPGFALSTAANATDIVTFTWYGNTVYATIERDTQGLATSAATASAVVQRDSAGRAQVATPSASGDIATKGYVDGLNVTWVAAPASATATGTAGQRAYDASYLYICTATNTWTRIPLNWVNGGYLAAMTAAATANTVMLRDASGRAQVATPSAAGDIATKGYVDGLNVAWAAVPATATAAGTAGQRAYDANYIYICVATNTWKRVAIATW